MITLLQVNLSLIKRGKNEESDFLENLTVVEESISIFENEFARKVCMEFEMTENLFKKNKEPLVK